MSLFKEYPYLHIVQRLAREKKVSVYLVGGFLRDMVLGRPCVDFDFAVEKQAVLFARRFARLIQGAFVLLDEEHGCARVAKKEDGGIATYDFADFRAPTFKKDLQHRDFTINTLACDMAALKTDADLIRSVLFSPRAKNDLKRRVIRMVSAKAFEEDPLRLMRAFSLRAMLQFKIDPQTRARIKRDKDLLRSVSPERVRDELFKVLDTPRAGQVLKEMDRSGLLERVIPQVSVMYHIKQGTYHHLDVWPHSLETVCQLDILLREREADGDLASYLDTRLGGGRTRRGLMKLAALLHDIGKPQTLKREAGRLSFHGHELIGKQIVRHIARQLKISSRERYALEDMVLWHLRPGYLSNFKKPTERAVFRFLRDAKEEAASISLLSLADQRSTRGPMTTVADQRHHERICSDLITRYFEKFKARPLVRLINGDHLIKNLKLRPSPLFKEILSAVEEQQALGKIKTRPQALAFAAQMAAKESR